MRRAAFPIVTGLALALLAVGQAGLRSPAEAQNADAGRVLFAKCLACHSAAAGKGHRTGPNLFGVAGRAAGSAEGFVYSDAMKAAGEGGLVWSDEKLEAYLGDPTGLVPESKMAWTVKEAGERRDLVAYIKTLK